MKKMIRAHVSEDQDNWDLGLSQLCFAYNSSIHETIGLSPFEVMFGRVPLIPIDLLYPNRLELTREKITQKKIVRATEIAGVDMDIHEVAPQSQIQILPDVNQYSRSVLATVLVSLSVIARQTKNLLKQSVITIKY